MRDEIHLHASDPLAWKAYADWLQEQGLPWEQPWIVNSSGMKFVLIPPGTFFMGSPEDEAYRDDNEGPQHEVEITQPFYLGVTPVTQEQYKRVMGTNPSHFSTKGGGKGKVRGMDTRAFPVECVSWEDAMEFASRLSALAEEVKSGHTYRLPAEAQWEYACRGGAPPYQVFHFGNSFSSTQANFNGSYRYWFYAATKGPYLERTCKVGSYPANGFGLYDMHGNVWEWCSDWYDESYYAASPRQDPPGPVQFSAPSRSWLLFYRDGWDDPAPGEMAPERVLRGGCWDDYGGDCRSANRYGDEPGKRLPKYGFRLAAVPSMEQR
jgi:formylglycine-generating enzyme required for sulfatase activity